MHVPYITTWTEERPLPAIVVEHPSGIRYADETLADRDRDGVLWRRMSSCPGQGRPQFGKVHPLRQRRAMRRLLCGICGGPADRSELGVLWVLRDYRDDWPGWPEGMAATEPPICQPCARLSVRLCPALRKGYVSLRVADSRVAGVYGIRYRLGQSTDDATVAFEDPAIRRICAAQLVRELRGCTMVDLPLGAEGGVEGPEQVLGGRATGQ